MARILSAAVALLVLQLSGVRAQTCYGAGDVAGIAIGTAIGVLLIVGIIVGIIILMRRKKKEKSLVKVEAKDSGNLEHGGYDNPSFTAHSEERLAEEAKQKGFGGYMQCKEYDPPARQVMVNPKKSNGSAPREWATAVGSAPLTPRLHKAGSRGSLDEQVAATDHELVSVSLQSQDIIGLGFNITGSMRDGIFVSQVHNRGPASESGKVQPGDRIMSILISFENMVYEDALTILSYSSPYQVRLQLQKQRPNSPVAEKPVIGIDGDDSNLHHPLFRSQSMDDVSKIGRESIWNMNMRRVRSEMKRGSSKNRDAKDRDSVEGSSSLRKWRAQEEMDLRLNADASLSPLADTKHENSSFHVPDMQINTSELMSGIDQNLDAKTGVHADVPDDEHKLEVQVHQPHLHAAGRHHGINADIEGGKNVDVDIDRVNVKPDGDVHFTKADKVEITTHVHTEVHAPKGEADLHGHKGDMKVSGKGIGVGMVGLKGAHNNGDDVEVNNHRELVNDSGIGVALEADISPKLKHKKGHRGSNSSSSSFSSDNTDGHFKVPGVDLGFKSSSPRTESPDLAIDMNPEVAHEVEISSSGGEGISLPQQKGFMDLDLDLESLRRETLNRGDSSDSSDDEKHSMGLAINKPKLSGHIDTDKPHLHGPTYGVDVKEPHPDGIGASVSADADNPNLGERFDVDKPHIDEPELNLGLKGSKLGHVDADVDKPEVILGLKGSKVGHFDEDIDNEGWSFGMKDSKGGHADADLSHDVDIDHPHHKKKGFGLKGFGKHHKDDEPEIKTEVTVVVKADAKGKTDGDLGYKGMDGGDLHGHEIHELDTDGPDLKANLGAGKIRAIEQDLPTVDMEVDHGYKAKQSGGFKLPGFGLKGDHDTEISGADDHDIKGIHLQGKDIDGEDVNLSGHGGKIELDTDLHVKDKDIDVPGFGVKGGHDADIHVKEEIDMPNFGVKGGHDLHMKDKDIDVPGFGIKGGHDTDLHMKEKNIDMPGFGIKGGHDADLHMKDKDIYMPGFGIKGGHDTDLHMKDKDIDVPGFGIKGGHDADLHMKDKDIDVPGFGIKGGHDADLHMKDKDIDVPGFGVKGGHDTDLHMKDKDIDMPGFGIKGGHDADLHMKDKDIDVPGFGIKGGHDADIHVKEEIDMPNFGVTGGHDLHMKDKDIDVPGFGIKGGHDADLHMQDKDIDVPGFGIKGGHDADLHMKDKDIDVSGFGMKGGHDADLHMKDKDIDVPGFGIKVDHDADLHMKDKDIDMPGFGIKVDHDDDLHVKEKDIDVPGFGIKGGHDGDIHFKEEIDMPSYGLKGVHDSDLHTKDKNINVPGSGIKGGHDADFHMNFGSDGEAIIPEMEHSNLHAKKPELALKHDHDTKHGLETPELQMKEASDVEVEVEVEVSSHRRRRQREPEDESSSDEGELDRLDLGKAGVDLAGHRRRRRRDHSSDSDSSHDHPDVDTSMEVNVNQTSMLMRDEPSLAVEESEEERSVRAVLQDYLSDDPSLLQRLGYGADNQEDKNTSSYTKTVEITSVSSNGQTSVTRKEVVESGDGASVHRTTRIKPGEMPDISNRNGKALSDAKREIRRRRSTSSDDGGKHLSSSESSPSSSPERRRKAAELRRTSGSPTNKRLSGGGMAYDITSTEFKEMTVPAERGHSHQSGGIAYYVDIDNNVKGNPPHTHSEHHALEVDRQPGLVKAEEPTLTTRSSLHWETEPSLTERLQSRMNHVSSEEDSDGSTRIVTQTRFVEVRQAGDKSLDLDPKTNRLSGYGDINFNSTDGKEGESHHMNVRRSEEITYQPHGDVPGAYTMTFSTKTVEDSEA